jgi:hypothetical protein
MKGGIPAIMSLKFGVMVRLPGKKDQEIVDGQSSDHRSLLPRVSIGLNHTSIINDLPWNVLHHASKKRFYYSIVDSVDPDLLNAITPHAEAVPRGLPEKQRRMHVRLATVFLYFFSPWAPRNVLDSSPLLD